jgi:CII-binding regulator of phage lambda lysogenization HflD
MKTVSLDQKVKCRLLVAIRPIQLWSSVTYGQNVRIFL